MANLNYHPETQEEKNYREYYLMKQLLRDKGYYRYAKALEDYRLNFVDEPGLTAAIDTNNGYVLINGNEKFSKPEKMSMLIRHELLHSLLEHVRREIVAVAKANNIDPDKITKVEFQDILAKMNRTTDFNLRRFNARNFGNEAGDLDLSRYYLQVDKDVVKEIGGLLLDDHPDWIKDKLYFEQIIDRCKAEDYKLRRRVTNKRYGKFTTDENGKKTFNKSREEQSVFRGSAVDPEDVFRASIPTVEDAKQIAKYTSMEDVWLYDEDENDPDRHWAIWYSNQPKSLPVARVNCDIHPMLFVKNADLYINIFGSKQAKVCICNNIKCLVLPEWPNKMLVIDSIGASAFCKLGEDADYEHSLVKPIVDKWFAANIK